MKLILFATVALLFLCSSARVQAQWTQTNSTTLTTTNNVGIGTTAPAVKLDINGDTRSTRFISSTFTLITSDYFNYDSKNVYNYALNWAQDTWNANGASAYISGWGGIKLFTNSLPRLAINGSGNVGIGTTNPQALLSVKGTIYCTRLKVTPLTNTTDWPDYVFAPDYKLLSLDSVESYVKTNKHLPDVASAQEVVNNGLDVVDNQKAMLQKIEELTLYIIQQQKAVKALTNKMAALEKRAKHTNK